MDPRFSSDRYFIRQRIRPMVNQYEVSTLAGDGKSAGVPVCFAQQKRMALKEDLGFYADDSRSVELFRIKARQIFDPRARYDVTDASGQLIGQLQKVFLKSLLRSTWRIYDAAGTEVATAQERSLGMALFRRFEELIPFIGGLLNMLPFRFHFTYRSGDRVIGEHTSKFGPRDMYILDLAADQPPRLDRRLAVALAVGLDALQAR